MGGLGISGCAAASGVAPHACDGVIADRRSDDSLFKNARSIRRAGEARNAT